MAFYGNLCLHFEHVFGTDIVQHIISFPNKRAIEFSATGLPQAGHLFKHCAKKDAIAMIPIPPTDQNACPSILKSTKQAINELAIMA